MNIREKYLELSYKDYKFSLIDEVNILKDNCILEDNQEYMYLCNILISDIYIEHGNFEEALNIILKDIRNVDKSVFQKIYISLLDRLIYIYITKRNYQVALRYAREKELYIDKDDSVSMNRWHLEISHIYAEIGQLDKAEACLKIILKNNPSIDIKPHVLNNLTKIYIDQKDIEAAKISLNQCLILNNDHEGEIYCDYLLAKICVLDGKNKDALKIYDNIFNKESIDSMTLTIVNDYLELLITMDLLDRASLLMNKIFLFINASDDLLIKHQFYKNRVKYFLAKNDNNGIATTLKEVDDLEQKILINEQQIINANFEDDKNDIVEKSVNDIIGKIDTLTNLVNVAINNNSLRDVIMDFCKKTQQILNFDEATFVLFNKIEEREFQMNSFIQCLRFKQSRLYEKTIGYENLRGTIVEMMVSKNKPMSIDFHQSDLKIKHVFNDKLYKDEGINYISAFPCFYKDDMFAIMIFSSFETDITTQNDTVLYKFATKLLESALTNVFIQGNMIIDQNTINMLVDNYNLGLVYINNNIIYLSEMTKKLLKLRHNTISRNEYKKNIAHADINKYNDAINSAVNYDVQYKYSINNEIVSIRENIIAYKDNDGKILFYIGTIMPINDDSLGYALSETDLNKKIIELKRQASAIEFRFSLVRIRGTIDEYADVKSDFGVEPYYLNDGTFVIILENEVNQRVLERLTKNFVKRVSIVRYPRDIMDIDELVKISKVCLDTGEQYFTDQIYKDYIKKISVSNAIINIINDNTKLNIGAYIYRGYDDRTWMGIKAIVNGISDKENPRDYLENEILEKFDRYFINEFLKKQIKGNCFIELSAKVIKEIIDNNDIERFSNIRFIISHNDASLPLILEKLRELKVKLYIHMKMIDSIDAYNFSSGLVEGIYIPSELDSLDYNKVIRLASMFNLIIVSYNGMKDWLKNCYYTGQIEKIE